MHKYRIMIVDDKIRERIETLRCFLTNDFSGVQPNRREELERICNENLKIEFEVIYPQPFENLETYFRNNKADAYFLDVLYEENNSSWNLQTIVSKVRIYNADAPIFVYSEDWRSMPIIEEVTNAFKVAMPGKTPAYFYDYNTIIAWKRSVFDSGSTTHLSNIVEERRFIKDTIAKAYGKTSKEPFMKNEKIAILHISDLQYGDGNTTDYTVDLWNEVYRKCRELEKASEISGIDILLISGDISMHGKASELKEAEEDLMKLFEKLWPDEYQSQEYRDRLILVPGNHDYDLNYCIMDYLSAKSDDSSGIRKIDFEAAIESLQDKNRKKREDYHKMGLNAYRDFAYRLTGNPVFYEVANLNFIERRFSDWNLRFICLNSCDGICADHTNGVKLNRREIEAIVQNDEEECYTIAVSHHTPLIANQLIEEERNEFQMLYTSIIRSCHVKAWLGGHRHIYDRNEFRKRELTCEVFEAPSLRLDESWGKDEAYQKLTDSGEVRSNRGFQIVVLAKDQKNEFIPTIHRYIFDENGTACKVKQ